MSDSGNFKRYFAFMHDGMVTNLAKFIDGTARLLVEGEWENDQSLARLFLRGPDVGEGIYVTEEDSDRLLPLIAKGMRVKLTADKPADDDS